MFNIVSGNILAGVLYTVYGGQSVTYNGVTYASGQTFRGVNGVKTFTFSGSGTQLVYEVTELKGDALVFDENGLDSAVFTEITLLTGAAIEFQQNANDISVDDQTAIKGFALELLDFPFYSFMISETRL